MPAWLIPALKAILPHIGTIVSTASPVFTRKNADAATNQVNQMQIMQQQIAELQAAASANDALKKSLAEQLQKAVTALEVGAATAERKLQRASLIAHSTLGLSLVALALGIFANA